MRPWVPATCVVLGMGACRVYDESDLPELTGGNSSTNGGRGGASGGSVSGGRASGGQNGGTSSGGKSTGGTNSGGTNSGGKSTGGTDAEGGVMAGGAPNTGGVSPTEGGTDPVGGVSPTGGATDGGTPPMGGASGGSPVAEYMIDDCEATSDRILAVAGRNGLWYTFKDDTATATIDPDVATAPQMLVQPLAERRVPESTAVFHMLMSGFTTLPPDGWGAGAGIDLRSPKAVYDASSYTGITFWAKAGATLAMTVKLAIRGTEPAPLGDVCAVGVAMPCEDHYGQTVSLNATWTQFALTWGTGTLFVQGGWGEPVTFAPSELVSLQFIVAPPDSENAEVWIDDVAFLTP